MKQEYEEAEGGGWDLGRYIYLLLVWMDGVWIDYSMLARHKHSNRT
jgi:hypothetical protein